MYMSCLLHPGLGATCLHATKTNVLPQLFEKSIQYKSWSHKYLQPWKRACDPLLDSLVWSAQTPYNKATDPRKQQSGFRSDVLSALPVYYSTVNYGMVIQ